MDAQEEHDVPTVMDRKRMVSQEAAYWYIRCTDERPMRRRDRKLFLKWLKTSPENVAAMLHMFRLDGRCGNQVLVNKTSELSDSNVYDIKSGEPVSHYDYNPSNSVPDTVKRKLRPAWAIAATVAAIAIFFGVRREMTDKPVEGTVITAASQWQHMTLDDGSIVHMDARTRLKIEFTPERRLIHLYEGQAVFEVAKDPDWPFTVRTDVVDVTAVGTRYGVAVDKDVTTTVSEGTVRVSTRDTQHSTDRLVRAGEEFRVPRDTDTEMAATIRRGTAAGAIADLSELDVLKIDAERKLDWANGWLSFNGETIGQAVREFNRRNKLQIEIDDHRIADQKLGVYRLRVDSTESFAKLLDSQQGIVVVKDDDRNRLHLKSE
jgi:transmembrane sensor